LRNYLQFVKTGHDTTPENSGALPDSDFEYFVIRRLQAIGYSVVPQLGVGKYRIDIAVVHPDIAGAYLAAIECDGESYHSAESARDRDRIRQEVCVFHDTWTVIPAETGRLFHGKLDSSIA
jgi:hypothetical protein